MKRMILSLASVAVAMTLLIPGSASAVNLKLIVEDRLGDVAPMYTARTYDCVTVYGENSPIVEAGYFDMKSFLFSLKGSTYTFGMEMAADRPQEGDPLPQGVIQMEYELYLDREAWDWSSAYEPSYFSVRLTYDELSYHAGLYAFAPLGQGEELMALPFEVKGSSFKVMFTVDSVDGLTEFWLLPVVFGWFGGCTYRAFLDLVDYNAGVPGQLWTSIPWPLCCE